MNTSISPAKINIKREMAINIKTFDIIFFLFLEFKSPFHIATYIKPPAKAVVKYAIISGIPWMKYFVNAIGRDATPKLCLAKLPITKPMTLAFQTIM